MRNIFNAILIIIILVFSSYKNPKGATKDNTDKVTYFNTIKSIVDTKCAICHKKGGAAPFELKSYKDIKEHSKMIKYAITNRYMPPWPANNDYVSFQNNHNLSDYEIETITQWINDGLEIGNKKDYIHDKDKSNNLLNLSDSKTKTKVIEITMPHKYIHDSKDIDIYIRTQLENTIESDTIDIVGFEIVPGNKNIVHHIELYAKNRLSSENEILPKDEFIINTDYFIDTINQRNLVFPEGGFSFYSGWLPGTGIDVYPEGTSKQISKNDELGLLIHYTPYPKIESDSTIVRLHYIDKKERQSRTKVRETAVINYNSWKPNKVFIKANEKETFNISMQIEEEMSLFAIHPHAHHLAVYMKSYAITPAMDTIPLIEIPQWDFDWQFFYRYKKYIYLPQGTIVFFEATYDNTTSNPENPYHPPKDIYSSFKANDEMMILFLLGKDYIIGDENRNVQYHRIPQK